jgi:hypothetical protein
MFLAEHPLFLVTGLPYSLTTTMVNWLAKASIFK